MQHTFQLILKAKTFTIPTIFKHSVDISPDIYNYLIFNSDHSYHVKSNVSEEVFQSFLNYLINDEEPDINLDNINQYYEISQEFNLLQKIISAKIHSFGEYFVNINGLMQKNTDLSKYEESIAINLDDYIEKYGSSLMQSPIQSLYNIFSHPKRNLNDHNRAYNVITQYFDETKNSSIFVLLDTLDGSKLTKSNLSEALALRQERMNHMPNVDFEFVSRVISKEEELESKFATFSSEFSSFKEKVEEDMKRMKKEHNDEIQGMKNNYNVQIQNLKNMLNLTNQNYEKEINDFKKQISDNDKKHEKEISEIKKQISENDKKCDDLLQVVKNNPKSFSVVPSLQNQGILERLKSREKNHFDRLFIASQSSCDIYNLLNPNTNDAFCTNSHDGFYIEFELEQKVSITGVKIFSSYKYFPKSFDIGIEGMKIVSVENAEDLNGKDKKMTINFKQVSGKKIRFTQTGPNWDKGTNYILIKRIEILSNEKKYAEGVFSTLIKSSIGRDRHGISVFITSYDYGFNTFYSGNISGNTSTLNEENAWFQIELTQGLGIFNGFVLERGNKWTVKSFKIICTDDIRRPINSWLTLFEMNEKREGERRLNEIYLFDRPSPIVRIVRIVQTGPNWSNDHFLKFHHFDLFGVYFGF